MLVLRAQSGDREAMEQLLTLHQASLYGFLSKVLRNPSDADDAQQATFLQVVRKLKHVREPTLFRSWMFRIASRIAYRIAAKRRQTVERSNFEFIDQVADTGATDDSQIKERLAKIPEWLDSLTHKGREVIVLHYLEGFTAEQVANILGIPLGTVKSRISYALQTLRQQSGEPPNVNHANTNKKSGVLNE